MVVEKFVADALRLKVEPVLRVQGYRSVDCVAPEILEVAQKMVAEATHLAYPHVWFGRHRVERITSDSLTVGGGPTFRGQCFSAHLAGAREFVCFLATIGPALDRRVSEMLGDANPLEALFLDTAGWLATEETLRAFRSYIGARVAGERLRLGPRLGPGYLDWALTEQASLFSLFDGIANSVTLSDDCLMTPAKSLSGLFGLIPRGTEA